MSAALVLRLNVVVVAVTDEEPRVVTVPFGPAAVERALPAGALDPRGDPTLELAVRAFVREQVGIELGYVEQLYTFGDRYRDPSERRGGPRVVSVAYVALLREGPLPAAGRGASWLPVYDFFPWEDGRAGRPGVVDERIASVLATWVAAAECPRLGAARRERADIAFGLGGASWDGDRVLERYEVLYEVGLVTERAWDTASGGGRASAGPTPVGLGRALALDHRRMLATALARLRGKLRYRPVVFELLPETFTLLELQRAVEALAGVRLHKQNFRRVVDRSGLVEGTGVLETRTGGRPAERFHFRREVLRERPAPGVGLPGARRAPRGGASG